MAAACANLKQNSATCACTYPGCPRHGVCCECIQYHLAHQQLPGCAFAPDVEAQYDRSFRKFVETHGQ